VTVPTEYRNFLAQSKGGEYMAIKEGHARVIESLATNARFLSETAALLSQTSHAASGGAAEGADVGSLVDLISRQASAAAIAAPDAALAAPDQAVAANR
jgi:hypothetical protein